MADTVPTPSLSQASSQSLPKSANLDPSSPETAEGQARGFEESKRPGKRQKLNPPQMTAAAAHADATHQKSKKTPPSTQTSPNPANQAVATLMGTLQNDITKADTTSSSANPATTLSAPMAAVAESLQQQVAKMQEETVRPRQAL